ncbi:hypothetical protein JJD66_11150 [Pseudomonas sp. MF6751]|uniref:hypothetical protein n=1 Tax=Pseudomonas TaxID=286 RepID=UPI0018E6397E|nr:MULTISPECIES: hypothetical protein [Pseudomonas]MBI6664656.1 hypothetical protein [Pseudomonas carnis]MBI6687216.1 hypothetical protein [Pseudomonas carnis]MBK3476644.1 hypothetical protein [Pseudomonas sp. MF6751]
MGQYVIKRSNLRALLFASLSGRMIYAIASLVALPLLSKLLGAEAVGLVGFFSTIVMVMMVFEGGLTSNVIQQLAWRRVREERAPRRFSASSGSLILTYVGFFAAVGAVLAFIIIGLSDAIVQQWLKFSELSNAQVEYSVKCMGVFVGLNLPVMILQGVFVGREQQVKLNALYIPYSLARTIGVLLVMLAFPDWRSVEEYFLIQVFIQITYLFLLIVVLSKEFAAVLGALSFRFLYLKRGWKFSRGVLLISITSIFVVQIDKLYLSGNSSLADYAAYSLASTLAGFPYIFSTALNSVLFPRFSINLDVADESKVASLFGVSCAAITFLMVVLCVAVYFFCGHLLALFFTSDLAASIGLILPILLIGTALQSVLIVPFALQLAAKWTSLALRLNLFWIPIVLLLLPALVHKFGVMGGAYAWLIYNVFSTALTFILVARRFSFLKAVNAELLRIFAVTLISSVVICYTAKAVAAAFLDTYAALAFETVCVLVIVLVGGYIFRKKLVHFR